MNSIEKKKLEDAIRSSILFSLNKQTEYIAYKREAMKMLEYLYRYLLVINEKKYIEFGYEIMVTAKRCISNYKADLGDFLNYFNSAWAKEYRRAFGKKQAEEFRCGIHITEDEQILVNKYLKLIDRYSNKYDESQVVSIIAEALCVSCDRVREIIALNNISVISGDAEKEDESDTIFDFIGEATDIESRFEAEDLIERIETEYQKLQQRQKQLISELITLKIAGVLVESDYLLNKASKCSFFDEEIFELSKKGLINAKAIASRCGVGEQSASRSVKIFLEKVKKNYA